MRTKCKVVDKDDSVRRRRRRRRRERERERESDTMYNGHDKQTNSRSLVNSLVKVAVQEVTLL